MNAICRSTSSARFGGAESRRGAPWAGVSVRRRGVLLLLALLAIPAAAQAQFRDPSASLTRSDPGFLKAFREVVAKPSASTVRVQCDGKDTALGMVVGPDGWILTKANDLHGDIAVRLRDGRTFDARWVGMHQDHDLALLKIETSGLTPIDFTESKNVAVGSWVACVGVGDDPAAVGVISVASRNLPTSKGGMNLAQGDLSKIGYLGVSLEQGDGHPVVKQIMPDTPAAKVGLKEDDLIIELNTIPMGDPEQFSKEIGKHKPGDTVTLKVRRGDEEMTLSPKLARRPPSMLRGEMQNRMGSELSSRRWGYPTILQHDSVVKPQDCGGPIVDLDGRVIGINICREGRTSSWAVPSEVLQPLLLDMMSGRLPPKVEAAKLTPAQQLERAKKALKNIEAERAALDKKVTDSKAEIARLESALKKDATAQAPRPSGGQAKQAASTTREEENVAQSVEEVLKLMQQRLAVMKDVASAKWLAKVPVADPEREAEVTAQLVKKGEQLGLKNALVRGFVGAQLGASKQLQESFFEQWRKDSAAVKVSADLQKDLRPKIDQITNDLLAALARLEPHLDKPAVQQLLRDRAPVLVSGDGITDAVRSQALAPLVRK
jgi:serine protease Do